MKFTTVALTIAATLGMGAAQAAGGGTADVTFNGTVVYETCVITPMQNGSDVSGAAVELGDTTVGNKAPAVPFSLVASDAVGVPCKTAALTAGSVTLSGVTFDTNGIVNEDTSATGATGAYMLLGQPGLTNVYTASKSELEFTGLSAGVIELEAQLGSPATGGTGEYAATATFTVAYN